MPIGVLPFWQTGCFPIGIENRRNRVTRPQVAAEEIPHVLKSIPHWVCWKYVERAGKPTKCPVHPRLGWNASAKDPQSWGTFAEALATCQNSDKLAGIGFVFSDDDPFCGLDLDDCLDESGTA